MHLWIVGVKYERNALIKKLPNGMEIQRLGGTSEEIARQADLDANILIPQEV